MYTFGEEAYNYANNIEKKSSSYEVDISDAFIAGAKYVINNICREIHNRGVNDIDTHNEIERLYDIFRNEYNECK